MPKKAPTYDFMNYHESFQDDLTREQLDALAREASRLLEAAAERVALTES